jgi:leucyl-tRNA synthetase
MADAGLVDFVEPFIQLRNQGMVLSAADGRKMSKSKGNVVTPDEVVAEHGADALRAYLLFLGPFDTEVIWDDRGIKGITRFLDKYWRLAQEVQSPPHLVALSPSQEFERRRHQTIKRITEDMAQFRFNTAVAALMAYLNYLIEAQDEPISAGQWRQAIETITLLLAPIAPFITEEVWQTVLGHEESVHCQPWPAYDEAQAAEVEITIVVQVNGKLRDRVTVVADAGEAAAREAAVNSPIIQHYLNGQTIRNVIVVPQKLVNIVV